MSPDLDTDAAFTQTSIEARLIVLNAQAKRQAHRDYLGRPSDAWADTHRRLDRLLSRWQKVRVNDERNSAHDSAQQ